ncbi:MAG: PorV/PorQ family protein [Ignavibacteria bacterium]|nr:PorV/PorQ family protein [Ignavibacteria bacterium]
MKQWIPRLILASILIQTMMVSAHAGRGDKAGGSAASELLIPVGARSIGLGSSSVATATGIEAIYWNPAGLARTAHASNAMFTHMNYIADIGVEYLAVSNSFGGFGTVGFSVKALSFGDIPVTTEDQPDGTGELASPTFVIIGGTYSRQLADRIGIGLTVSLISERMERVSSSGIAFNVGVQYSGVGGINGLSLGVVVKNIGPQMRFDGPGLLRQGQINDVTRPGSFYLVDASSAELPSVMEMGLAYTSAVTEDSKVTVSGMFQNNNFSNDEYKLGAEYAFNETFFFRGGYNFISGIHFPGKDASERDRIERETASIFSGAYGWSFGAGFRTVLSDVDLSVDYAYRAAQFFGGNHVVGVSFGF